MVRMTRAANKATVIFSATLAAVIMLFVSYWAFRWQLIKVWQWQHEGRPIVFTFGPDMDAAVLATMVGIAVFILIFRRLRREM